MLDDIATYLAQTVLNKVTPDKMGLNEMTPESMTPPLLATLERARQLDAYLGNLKAAPEGAEWLPMQSLLSPTGEVLCEMLERVATAYPSHSRQLPASLFFGWFAYGLMAFAHACYLLDRRVPRLAADTLWLRFGERGDVAGIALTDYRFAALETDPASQHDDCLCLPSVDALQEYLLEQAATCLKPLTQAVRAHSTLGVPAMWALAADYVASAAIYVGRSMDDQGQAVAYARQLAAKPSPLQRKRDFIHIEECGQHYEMVDRISCCLYFKAEGGDYCSTCPHRPQEERVGLIRNWLAETTIEQSDE